MEKFKLKIEKRSTLIVTIFSISVFISTMITFHLLTKYGFLILNTDFFDIYKVMISTGITIMMLGFNIPKNYKSNGKSKIYGNFKEVNLIRVFFALIGIILYSIGTMMGSIPFPIFLFKGDFRIIILILFLILFLYMWISNRNDYLFISDEKIRFYDNDKGEFEIIKSEIKSIKLIKTKKILSFSNKVVYTLRKIIIKNISGENLLIDLTSMSITNNRELIENDIIERFSEKLS